MRIAMIQMEVKAGDKDRNISHARTMLTEAAAKADVLVLPEMWTVGYDFRHLDEQACMPGDELLVSLEEWAIQHKKYVVAGSLPTRESGQLYRKHFCNQTAVVRLSLIKKHHPYAFPYEWCLGEDVKMPSSS